MKYSAKLSDTLHILILIHLGNSGQRTSAKIAESIKTNPAYVRQLMAKLKASGIISNTQGHANASLTRSPEEISMLEVYRAVEGNKPLLHLDTDTNPECGVGINIQFAISDFYDEIQETVNSKMAAISLKDIIDRYHQKLEILSPDTAAQHDGFPRES